MNDELEVRDLRNVTKQHFSRLMRPAVVIWALVCSVTSSQATVYAILISNREIAIASDSRRIWIEGTRVTDAGNVEKVIPLGTKLAFMSSGMTEISGTTSAVHPSQLVRKCYSDLAKRTDKVSIKTLATAFANLTAHRLNRLSESERAAALSLAQRFGSRSGQVTESIIAGLDSDGILKVETIDFYVSRSVAVGNDVLRFQWTLDEVAGTKSQHLILSGEVAVLKSAFEDSASPIRKIPSFESWARTMAEGKQVDEAQTAEALVDLAIKYSPPDGGRLGAC